MLFDPLKGCACMKPGQRGSVDDAGRRELRGVLGTHGSVTVPQPRGRLPSPATVAGGVRIDAVWAQGEARHPADGCHTGL